MTNAAKHFDPQIGIDIHMYELVPGTPPVPLPTAHISMVLDPFDYLPFIGATVQVAGVKRAIAGTGGVSVHIPLALWVPFLRAPEGPQFDDEIFMGSKTVLADDSPFSRMGMPVLDCSFIGMVPPFRLKKPEKPHMSMSMPTAVNLAIPDSVFIGGPPTISMMAIATKLGFAALGKGFKALRRTKGFQRAEEAFNKARQKLFKNMEPGFLKCKVLRAEPVDIRDGSVSVSHEDFYIPGRLPLTWSRNYSSNNSHDGICGYGWQTPADFRLEVDADGTVLFFETNGVAVFPHLPKAAGADHAVTEFVDGARLSWIRNDSVDELHVVTKDDLRYVFRKPAPDTVPLVQALNLQIQKIEDLCGNHWRFERVDGHLIRIIENGINELAGRFIEVYESAEKIHQLSLHDPATGLNHPLVAYKYHDNDLIAAIDVLDGARTFSYEHHHMVRHVDRLGLSFHYSYDSGWRVIHAWGDQGLHDYHFAYDFLLRETEITDSLGHISLIKFGEDNLPLCEIDALGGVTIFEYDGMGRTTAVVDPMNGRTEFTYDERGNLLKLLQADGSTLVMSFDDTNHMTTLVDANGQHWRRRWDERGLLSEQCSPLGACSRFFYNTRGQLVTHINPRGANTTLAFDRYGCISQLTDPLGHSSHFEHDARGCLKRHIDPLGDVAEYSYDAKGRLLQVHSAGATPIQYQYDLEDQLVSHTDKKGVLTRMEYVGTGKLAKRVQGDGHVLQYFYNTEEQLVSLTNQRNESYQLKRDALGRIVEEVDYWEQSRQYLYDASGNLLNAVDPLGRAISYVIDRLGRIVKKTTPDNDNPLLQTHETFCYDKNGALIEMRNSHRHILRRFDADGRLSEELQDGFQITYQRDAAGNRLVRETSAGNQIVASYDLCDQLASIVINDGLPISIERDALGRAVNEYLSASVQRQLSYDATGNLTAQTVLRDQTSLFAVSYEYDCNGNQTRRDDSEHGSDLYSYDPLGNILRHTNPAGKVTEFINDAAGDRLRTRILQREMKLVAGAEDQAEMSWNREGTYENSHYVFDRTGNLIRRDSDSLSSANTSGASSTLQLRWDANQRLIESNKDGQVTRYGYDPLGRRVFKRNLTHTTWFFWDGDALLGDVRQVNNTLEFSDIWSGDNVVNFIVARRRLSALKTLHSQTREFVYYPGTFSPLALIEQQTKSSGPIAHAKPEKDRGPVVNSLSRPPIDSREGIFPGGSGGLSGMGGLGSIRLGVIAESVSDTNLHTDIAGLYTAAGLGLGAVIRLPNQPDYLSPSSTIPGQFSSSEVGIDGAPIEEETKDRVFHYHCDPNGCPTRLTDRKGQVVWSAGGSVWGDLLQKHISIVDNPIRLQGQYCDEETGLHYNRYRYYDPHIGQFIALDPIGLAGGDNLYQYAPNLIGWIDPLGLAKDKGYKVSAQTAGGDALARGVHVNVHGPGLPAAGGHVGLVPNAKGDGLNLVPVDAATRNLKDNQWAKVHKSVGDYLESNVDRMSKAAQAGVDAYPNTARAREMEKVRDILNGHSEKGAGAARCW
jgi:RHS repeat-associated protein